MSVSNANDEIKKWVVLSLTLHISALALLVYLNNHSKAEREFYAPVYKINLVTPEKPKSADTTTKPPQTPVEKEKIVTPEIKAKKEDAPKPAPKPAPKNKAIKKAPPVPYDPAAAIAAIRKKQETGMEVEKIKEKLEAEDAPASENKTRKKSADSSAAKAGVKKLGVENMDRMMQVYYDLLWERIENAWVLPGSGNFEGMVSIITIIIGRSGELIKVYIEEGSGNGFYDQAAIRAVKKSAPFPPLPEGYEGGLEIGFRFKL